MGIGKTGRGVGRYFAWEMQKLGTYPAIPDTFLGKIKGNVDQIIVRAVRQGMADSAEN